MRRLPMLPVLVLMLVALLIRPALGQTASNAGTGEELVPYQELCSKVDAFMGYLLLQRKAADQQGMTPTALASSYLAGSSASHFSAAPIDCGPARQPQPVPRPGLPTRPSTSALPAATNVYRSILHRVLLTQQDFYEANLAPLAASKVNIEVFHEPVQRKDLDKLETAFAALKTYEASLQALKVKEDAIAKQEETIVDKVTAIHRAQTAIRERYAPLFTSASGFGQEAAYDQLVKRYRAEMDDAGKDLPDLFGSWNDLDLKDELLAQAYVRKIFTFVLPPTYRSGNKVMALIDGHDVFQRVDALLHDVAKNGGKRGYVHISLWWCQTGVKLTASETFLQAIKAVADAGGEVGIALWEPSDLAARNAKPARTSKKDNEACKQTLEKLNSGGPNGNNVHVELLKHKKSSGSYHEKYFIFYNGSEVRAIVGGLNVDSGENSTPNHATLSGVARNDRWTDVHDVAVEIAGPAVHDVEADFSTRWYASGEPAGRIAGPTMQFAEAGTDDVAIAVTNPGIATNIVVDILSAPALVATVKDAPSPPRSISSELISRIQQAENFVYIENYAVYDEDIISALGARIAAQKRLGRPFPVIIVVHYEPDQPGYNDFNQPYSFLHYITHQHLSFMGCDSFDYVDDIGVTHTVERDKQGVRVWKVDPYDGGFYEKTTVEWDDGSAKLTDIKSFKPDRPLYTVAYMGPGAPLRSQAVWVHSKVSIFDDRYAGVGSANFNPRSLKDDGELTAFLHGNVAADLRRRLWTEYLGSNPDPDRFNDIAQANAAHESDLAPGKLYVVPILDGDSALARFQKWYGAGSTMRNSLTSARTY